MVPGRFFTGIALAGDFAYVVEERGGENFFTVLDLHFPENPQRGGAVGTKQVRQLDTRFPIAVAGRLAYLGQYAFGLQAIDISNPDQPRLVGRIDTPSETLSVTAAGEFIYVGDLLFGLQVIRGPRATPEDQGDPDMDSVINFFDVFPNDHAESQDTDGDGRGDNTDRDDDNDGFKDGDDPDPTEPRIFPVQPPPVGTTTIVVDAHSAVAVRERNGTPDAPYHSITEALRAVWALKASAAPQVEMLTLEVRAGTYSPLTTQEIFPLELTGLSHLMLKGAGWKTTIIDAQFTADVLRTIGQNQIGQR
jgi:hypothetical protein